jgi:hypothetical protein
MFKEHPAHKKDKKFSKIVIQDAKNFYGESYQDIQTRYLNQKAKRSWLVPQDQT